jgi:sulfite exporter TauE/SafE
VLFKAYLPEPVQEGAETAVGVVIVALAVWLLVRWRRGFFHVHLHSHDARPHLHGHSHEADSSHPHKSKARSPLQAYGIGLVHGLGGTAGVGILLLATIQNRALAVVALGLFAFFTAVSMALLSTGFGVTLSTGPMRRSFNRLAPALGTASLLFGLWYALGALAITPYYF